MRGGASGRKEGRNEAGRGWGVTYTMSLLPDFKAAGSPCCALKSNPLKRRREKVTTLEYHQTRFWMPLKCHWHCLAVQFAGTKERARVIEINLRLVMGNGNEHIFHVRLRSGSGTWSGGGRGGLFPWRVACWLCSSVASFSLSVEDTSLMPFHLSTPLIYYFFGLLRLTGSCAVNQLYFCQYPRL